MSPQIHPAGFRISERPVAASFAHTDSFQRLPEYTLRDDACLASSTSLGGEEGFFVRYWDEASTIAVLEFKVEEPTQPATSTPAVKEKKKKPKSASISFYIQTFDSHTYFSGRCCRQATRGSVHIACLRQTGDLELQRRTGTKAIASGFRVFGNEGRTSSNGLCCG